MSAKSEPQPLDVIQGRRQVGVIFKVAPSGMGGRGGWAFKNMESGRLFTFARLREAKDEAWKSFAGCIFKRQKPLARLAPYARGTVAGPREENPEPSKEESGIAAERAKNPLPDPAGLIANAVISTVARTLTSRVIGGENIDVKREENPVKKARSKNPARYEVIPSRMWVNRASGARASIYGAAPGIPVDAGGDWEIMTVGYTVRNLDTGTVGIGRQPWKTEAEARKWVADMAEKGRATNPGDIHIDIQSHNTKGKNVRAKNPGETIPLLVDSTDHVALSRVLPRAVGFRKTPEGWRADATVAQLRAVLPKLRANGHIALANDIEAILPERAKNPGEYYADESPEAKNPGAGDKVPPLNRWMNFAGDSYQWIARDNRTEDRPSDMRSFYIDPMTDQRGKVVGWSMREWDSRNGGHRPVLSFKTKTDALKHVREIMGTGRATNPAELSAKAIPAGKILLVLVGHPGGLGYYTGQTWDTVKSKAIRFDSVAGAKEAAKRLAPFLPGNAHIEVRSE